MIVGGTGTLGLLMATWAVQSLGARHIRLLGRTGKGATAASAPEDNGGGRGQLLHQRAGLPGLVGSGASSPASISVMMCDASSSEDAALAFSPSAWGGYSPPVCAVLHAGGVLADSTLAGQSLSSVR